ncbi:hypothetical protein GX51_03774 [Blastomyces parvus]|uniref:Archaemetzincin-2 n=1 Tax=Blastomyces parvus TaxID=2060905 RepID=A0A2B7X5J4_9EURO|nr:hypothetical protein GX51_03774 [Blastomyces parvus]
MSHVEKLLSSTQCTHSQLQLLPSSHANEAGYHRPSVQERRFACLKPKDLKDGSRLTRRERKDWSKENVADMTAFPSPLVLPGDDIAIDVDYPHQSFDAWLREGDRNEIMSRKNVVYVAAPPDIDNDVSFISQWDTPRIKRGPSVTTPNVEDVLNYLKAFYHGLPVKLFPTPLSFTSWESGRTRRGSKTKSKREEPQYIGFNIGTECVRIRTRASPDETFPRQLNLDDLLDAVISMLPKDAYALLLIVKQDLYESADDTFVCGRAYGGSRVAVVSTSRYNPILDGKHNVDREHSWPASHCKDYVVKCCIDTSRPKKRTKLSSSENHDIASNDNTSSPLPAALSAHMSLTPLDLLPTTTQLAGLWLGRVCRTASHELGHCFGIDHCMYYACSMQGSASLAEDARQPPYLCPVDLAKMLRATGTTAKARYLALLSFCKRHEEIHLFAAFAAWIASRLDGV